MRKSIKPGTNEKPFEKSLRKLMKARKTSTSTLGKLINCDRSKISKFTNGTSVPNIYEFKAIADFFNVSYEHLFGEVPAENREHIDISKQTGLSDGAITALKFIKKKAHNESESSTWRLHLKVINQIIAYGGESVVSPIVSYIQMMLNEAKHLKESDPICWESIGQPSSFEELQSILNKITKERYPFDLNEIAFSESNYNEWKLYKGQRVFTEKVVSKIYNSEWEEMINAERSQNKETS